MGFYKKKPNGKWEVTDAYTNTKTEISPKKLPDGSDAEVFTKYEVRLLKDIPSGEGWNYKKGDTYHVEMTPACEWYLMDQGMCFKSDAEKDKDFEFIT